MKFPLIMTSLLFVASTGAAQQTQPTQQPVRVEPTIELESQTAIGTVPGLGGLFGVKTYVASGVGHKVKIVYERAACDVRWNEYCDDEWMIEADEGMQVCKAVYSVTAHEGWDKELKIQPASSYPNDPQEPDRFRAIVFKLSARGTMKPWDQRGSKEVVENIGIDMIPAEADNHTRYVAGCWMPQT